MTMIAACSSCKSEKLEELKGELLMIMLPNIEFKPMYCTNCKILNWIKKDAIEPIGDGMWKYV